MPHVAIALALAGLFIAATPAAADPVVLTAPDGSLRLEGKVLSDDGEFLRFDTIYGVLTVDAKAARCEGAGCPGDTYVAEIRLSGAAETGRRLMPALLEAFAEERRLEFVRQDEDEAHFLYLVSRPGDGMPVARFWFRVTSTAEGFADLLAEEADIVMAARPVTPEEREMALDAGVGDIAKPGRSRIVALDALVPVTMPDGAAAVTPAGIARALSGDGPGLRLSEISPEAALPILARRLGLEHPDAHLQADVSGQRGNAGAEALVLAPRSLAGDTALAPFAGSCGISLVPDPLAMKAGDYPLTLAHYIYTPDRRLPRLAHEFLDWLDRPAAQSVIRAQGFVDRTPVLTPLDAQGSRLVGAIRATDRNGSAPDLRRTTEVLAGMARVSVSFRFDDGSTELDPPSRANIGFIANEIAAGRIGGGRIILAGFSDGQGGPAANRAISTRRADAVRAELLRALPAGHGVEFVTDGFGEAMPLACDEDVWGRRVNRRVEIWVDQR